MLKSIKVNDWFYYKVEELKLLPSELEKTITDHKKKLEKLEGDKKVEEEKLAAVMESLKTETKVLNSVLTNIVGVGKSVDAF